MANRAGVAGPNSKYKEPEAEPAGFWAGIWHGMSMPITLIVSFFSEGVGIYETHNKGRAYDVGFVLGASMAFGGQKGVKVKVGGDDKDEDDDEEPEVEPED